MNKEEVENQMKQALMGLLMQMVFDQVILITPIKAEKAVDKYLQLVFENQTWGDYKKAMSDHINNLE